MLTEFRAKYLAKLLNLKVQGVRGANTYGG
jgi:hypothetical protein